MTDGQKRRQKRRVEKAQGYVNSIKNNPCVDCSREFFPVCMDFDHVRGTKVRDISTLASKGKCIRILMEEIAKCDLVCACCHRIRTAVRGYIREAV